MARISVHKDEGAALSMGNVMGQTVILNWKQLCFLAGKRGDSRIQARIGFQPKGIGGVVAVRSDDGERIGVLLPLNKLDKLLPADKLD